MMGGELEKGKQFPERNCCRITQRDERKCAIAMRDILSRREIESSNSLEKEYRFVLIHEVII